MYFSFLQDLKDTLVQELDFVNEGKNSERCQSDLSHLKYVYVPKVHWDKTSTVRTNDLQIWFIEIKVTIFFSSANLLQFLSILFSALLLTILMFGPWYHPFTSIHLYI